jgi:hypothetical protein
MSVPFGKLEDHAVGIWFGAIALSYWIASFTLIPVGSLFLAFGCSVLLTVFVRGLRTHAPGRTAGSFVLGIAVYGPLVVTFLLLLNLIPTSSMHREEHKVLVIGRHCIGSRSPWCRPTVNFDDGAYAEWIRARVYSFGLPDRMEFVHYATYRGLFGATVILRRTELNEQHQPI